MAGGSLTDFGRRRQMLQRYLEAAGSLAVAMEDRGASQEAEKLSRKLVDNRFNLVVLGQFKRGKSTLINALLGDDLLPTGVLPLTSIITKIAHGPRGSIRVHFEDGSAREIQPGSLADYVTERGNPENRKRVRDVLVHHPSPYLKDGVVLTDTPGVGSAFLHNTEVAYRFLPEADAVIFVLAVDPPVSQSELEFVADIRRLVPKIFFVQNKIDYLGGLERRDVLEYTRSLLERELDSSQIRVYALSARKALEARRNGDQAALEESGLPRFLRDLERFLLEEKGDVLILSTARAATDVVNGLELAVKVELGALSSSTRELETKVDRLERELAEIERKREENTFLLRGAVEKLVSTLDEDVARFREETTETLLREVEKYYEARRNTPVKELNRDLEAFLLTAVKEKFDAWVPLENEKMESGYAAIVERFSRETDETVGRIRRLFADLFHVDLEPLRGPGGFTKESSLYYRLGSQQPFFPTIDPLALSAVLPRRLVHGILLKRIREKVVQLVDQNAGRVRYDFFERIRESRFSFESDLKRRVEETLTGLGAAIDRGRLQKARGGREAAESRRRLDRWLEEARKIKADLAFLVDGYDRGRKPVS